MGESGRGIGADHMSRDPDDEIRGNRTLEGIENPILPGRHPESDVRQILGDRNDIPKVVRRLQVAAIVPPKVPDIPLHTE